MRRALWLAAALLALAATPAQAEYTFETVRVPMRDGVPLSVEIWRPAGQGQVPVILHLTPYHALSIPAVHRADALPTEYGSKYVNEGYAFVFADVRGTWASGGCWDYGGVKEREDGYDLVEWLGTRDWSNGKVAMMGASYPGTTPNAAAVENPPHLATIVPISGISRWYGYAYQQGVRATTSGEDADIDPPGVTPTDFMFTYGFLPPPDAAALADPTNTAMRWTPCDRVEQALRAHETQPDFDEFWAERDYLRRAHQVQVPVLLSHGQLDFNVKTWEGTQWWEALNVPKVLVMGQWPHDYPTSHYEDWQDLLDRWFERWLKGVPNGVEHEPRVRVETNDGEWHIQDDWGAVATDATAFRLGGGTFEYTDDGLLSESEILRDAGEGVRWVKVPVPGTGGVRFGGRPRLRLRASSSAAGTHFVAVLCDVGPGGDCDVVSRAFMNARYRGGLERGVDLEPGEPYTFELEFIDKDYVVAPDHQLELRIASSNSTWALSDEHHATNTLLLDESELVLPIYPGGKPKPRPVASAPPAAAPATPAAAAKAPAATKRKKAKRKRCRKTRRGWRTKAGKRCRPTKAERRAERRAAKRPRR